MLEITAQAVQRAKAVGKPIGTVGGTVEVVQRYRAMGFDFTAIASDLGLLMRSAQAAIGALGQAPAEGSTVSGGY